ncbi:acyltransferase domain-containing protein [Streptomyces sp. NPDC042207]|uniref:acyltransferase domain-containing protein n=1 Tax=Streptomyces sp. NPDC042207 TaxID=3154331 RepID=UPI0033C645BC
MEDGGVRLDDVAYSLLTTRSSWDLRAVVVADGRQNAVDGANALARGESAPNVFTGRTARGKLAVLFSGQGSQRAGMGRDLYAAFPVFARAFDDVCCALDHALHGHVDRPVADVVFAEDATRLNRTVFTQTGLFAFEVALFRLVESWGVRPHLVAGHSIGEIAAAHVAGVLSLPDAATLVAARARLMQSLPTEGGAMVAVQAAEEEVVPMLSPRVSIGGINGPTSIVVSGDEDEALAIAAHFSALGRKTKRLQVSHAGHSPRMDGMLEEFARSIADISFDDPDIPVVSNVTGRLAEPGQLCSPQYWVEHIRLPVRFADCARELEDQGVTTFLELGPSGVLSGMLPHCLPDAAADAAFVPALRGAGPEVPAVVGALGQLYIRAVPFDRSAFFSASGARRVALPTYAFDRRHFWLASGNPTVEVTHPVSTEQNTSGSLADRLAALSEEEQNKVLAELVLAEAVVALGDAATDSVEHDSPFFEVGFNSLIAVELRNRLNEATGLTLSPMLVFDHPTPGLVVDHLRSLLIP